MNRINFSKYHKELEKLVYIESVGKVTKIVGLTIESEGPEANIGEICEIILVKGNKLKAEVVGFRDKKVLLMPFGDMSGIGPGCKVISSGNFMRVGVGKNIAGRVLDGSGEPIDGKGQIEVDGYYDINSEPPNPLLRKRINIPLPLGVKAIDSLLTVGKGQRVGIFAGSGVGKSTLLGMIARNTKADINVICLIGERGREVREFIEKDLKEEGLKRSVVIVATSDKPALVRLKSAYLATAVAEYYRDMGKDVLLLMDSLTRFSMAQREIGLAVGEPPVSKGYTPSVFAQMPKLLERAGNSDKGSITGLYTVLVDGDDLTEPITDTARGILDGHIVLSRALANKNHYPAIDVLASISRVMSDIVTDEHKKIAGIIKGIMATYKDAEDLINIGAYTKGSNKSIDNAISKIGLILDLIQQGTHDVFSFDDTVKKMKEISNKK
jgi:flagellum-specific ATP synthase